MGSRNAAKSRRARAEKALNSAAPLGPDMARIADETAAFGTVINALVIYGDSPSLIRYFDRELVRGAGSFSHAIELYADYPEAIRRKLLRELQQDVSMNADPDPSDGARVVGGPAPWQLAALPLRLDEGRLIVAGEFIGRVGFQQPGLNNPFGF